MGKTWPNVPIVAFQWSHFRLEMDSGSGKDIPNMFKWFQWSHFRLEMDRSVNAGMTNGFGSGFNGATSVWKWIARYDEPLQMAEAFQWSHFRLEMDSEHRGYRMYLWQAVFQWSHFRLEMDSSMSTDNGAIVGEFQWSHFRLEMDSLALSGKSSTTITVSMEPLPSGNG